MKSYRFLMLLSLLALGGCRESPPQLKSETPFAQDVILQTLEKVRQEYVDKPDEQKMLHGALNGMLMALDPYSGFLNADSYKIFTSSTKGEFGGLGMEVFLGSGLLKVIAPMDDTPAQKAGIKAGDLITHVDDIPLAGLPPEEAFKRLHGKPGTSVSLKIHRPPASPFTVKLTRELIILNPVKYRLEGNIGYLRISYFNDQTSKKLKEAVHAIQKSLPKALRGLVVDLRNNPGGTLEQAVGVANFFLESGVIVQVRGRDPGRNQTFKASGRDALKGIPIAILINRGSASGSEIVAAALRDNHRAVLIGEKTFGKGSVQALYDLKEYGGIKITIARFYTPDGKEIQGQGIEPDIQLPLHPQSADMSPPPDGLKETVENDRQLQRALDVLQGLWAVKKP